MALFYDYSNDDGTYEAQHSAAKSSVPLNLGHGPTCDNCNDAVLHATEQKMGRLTHFKMGRLESKFDKGSWR